LLPALASRPLRDDDLEKASMDTSGRRLGTTTLEVLGPFCYIPSFFVPKS
jgi:hypothetical protein